MGTFIDPEKDLKDYFETRPQGTFNRMDYVRWLAERHPLPVRRDPIPNWRARLANLQAAKDPHAALKMYADFVTQTTEIREQIDQSAAALDQYIERRVSEAREE